MNGKLICSYVSGKVHDFLKEKFEFPWKIKQKQLYCKGRDVLKRLWQIDIRKGWGNKKWCSTLKKKSSARANRGPDCEYNRNPGCLDWKRDGRWGWTTLYDNSYTIGHYSHGRATVPWDLVEKSPAVLFLMEASYYVLITTAVTYWVFINYQSALLYVVVLSKTWWHLHSCHSHLIIKTRMTS